MKKSLERGIEIAILVTTAAVLFSIISPWFLHHERNSAEVRALYETLQLDMTREQVRHAMDSGTYPHLAFYRDGGQSWIAEAPFEFGAGNWILWVEFQRDRVSMVRVRTANGDQDYLRPDTAPPDKGRRSGRPD